MCFFSIERRHPPRPYVVVFDVSTGGWRFSKIFRVYMRTHRRPRGRSQGAAVTRANATRAAHDLRRGVMPNKTNCENTNNQNGDVFRASAHRNENHMNVQNKILTEKIEAVRPRFISE
ncbi:hypothetical protein EVAR_62473_1 [Eumeta japonica]|uniref:Uncharacterized protein n=1 Tax=Eumeta variegata TaxID=151549 RepID=A0A4C1ZHI6_EUMVA|nr:hypothetical protein EVAR_62473_1 [Eumeta japonica]